MLLWKSGEYFVHSPLDIKPQMSPYLASHGRLRGILLLQPGLLGLGVAENDAIPCGFGVSRPLPDHLAEVAEGFSCGL